MKKLNNQTGSAHVIIIIILIAAVLGLLGFVFWNNYLKVKPSADTTNKTTNSQQSTNTPVSQTDFVVKEWGVVGSYQQVSSNTNDLNYKFKKIDLSNNKIVVASASDSGAYLVITSPALDALCGSDAGLPISRATGESTMSAGVGYPDSTAAEVYKSISETNKNYSAKAHVGNYYYFLSAPQGACADPNTSNTSEGDILKVAKSFLENLKTI